MKEKRMIENKTITLGDALENGLLREIFTNSDNTNIKAAISYLYLNDFISAKCALKLSILVGVSDVMNFEDEDKKANHISDIVSELINDWKFSSKVRIRSLDALLAYTAKLEIPDWMIKKADDIYEYIPDVVYLKDSLFYLVKDSGKTSLIGEPVSGLFNSEKLAYECGDNIEGIDKDRGIIYFTCSNIPDVHYEYHIDDNYLKVIKNELVGIADGIPVYEVDGNIVIGANGSYNTVIKAYSDACYDIRDGYILVQSEDSSTDILEPFIVFLDGRRKPCSEAYVRNYIWQKILSFLEVNAKLSFFLPGMDSDKYLEDEKNTIVPIMTVSGIRVKLQELLGDRYFTDKRVIHFDQVLEILSRHCDPDNFELTELLYTLISAERSFHDDYANIYGFTSMTYFRLLDLEKNDNLDKLLLDSDLLREKMKIQGEKKAIVKDGSKPNTESLENKWVGCFEFTDDDILFSKDRMGDAFVLDDSILYSPAKTNHKGMITFNTKTNKFFIYYHRNLNSAELDILTEEFEINDSEYYMIVQSI